MTSLLIGTNFPFLEIYYKETAIEIANLIHKNLEKTPARPKRAWMKKTLVKRNDMELLRLQVNCALDGPAHQT